MRGGCKYADLHVHFSFLAVVSWEVQEAAVTTRSSLQTEHARVWLFSEFSEEGVYVQHISDRNGHISGVAFGTCEIRTSSSSEPNRGAYMTRY